MWSNSFSQDSLYKQVNTDKFNLIIEYNKPLLNKSGLNEKQVAKREYNDCNTIFYLSDSSFKLNYKHNNDLILYKNISTISFQSKRRFSEGLWKGAATGGIAGIFTMLAFPKTFFPQSVREGGGGFILFFIYESLFMLSGSAVGGIIGALSFEYDTYDIAKFPPNQRKEKTINLLLKYQINF
jgi:hypothetical protein